MKMWTNSMKVLMWKHMVVRGRRYFNTLLEILFPLLFIVLLVSVYKTTVNFSTREAEINHSEPIPIDSIIKESALSKLFYAPRTTYIDGMMKNVADNLRTRLEGFDTEEELLLKKGKLLQIQAYMMAVIFQNISFDGAPENLTYKIRSSHHYETRKDAPDIQIPGPHEEYGRAYESFVAVQMAINKEYIERQTGHIQKNINFQSFPYPAIENNMKNMVTFTSMIPMGIIIGQLIPLIATVVRLVTEKSTGIKELVKMMGVKSNHLWVSHLINCLVTQIIVLLVMVPILKFTEHSLVPGTDGMILYITLLLYVNYVIMLAFFFSTFFNKVMLASLLMSVLWLISANIQFGLPKTSLTSFVYSLVPNTPLYWFFQIVIIQETNGGGLHWDRLLETPSGSCVNCFIIWCLFVAQFFVLAFMTWFVDKVNPGTYGVAKDINFLWKFMFNSKTNPMNTEEYSNEHTARHSEYIEPLVKGAEVGISIRDVWKTYGSWGTSKKTALSGISMDIYKGGITALLGHNGAGKTTLMSIITGMIPASKGSVTIDNNQSTSSAGKSIGLCPQHNLVFPDLTLEEHLIFFGMIKEMTKKQAKKECKRVLDSLGLANKASWLCIKLSGGMMRRAQLGIALVGSPQILVLDEPTSGLDPHSRRQLWDILLCIRDQHTILITTHFMEEADVLGDRVAIVNHGQLYCYGTPMFLKKKFGMGYILNILTTEKADRSKITDLVKAHIGVEVLCGEEQLMRFRLLIGSSTEMLLKLFEHLEGVKEALGVTTIGLSLTTLEEVFLKVTEDPVEMFDGNTHTLLNVENNVANQNDEIATVDNEFLNGISLYFQQVGAMIKKKIYYFRFNKLSVIFQLLFVYMAILLPIISTEDKAAAVEFPPLLLSPNLYHHSPLRFLHSVNNTEPPKRLSSTILAYNMIPQYVHEEAYDAILSEGQRDPSRSYTGNLQVAMSFGPEEYTALYSTSVYHALPVAADLLSNILAADAFEREPPIITTINHPISPDSVIMGTDDEGITTAFIISWVMFTVLGFFILEAIFLLYPMEERVNGSWELQYLAGVCPPLRWSTMILTDWTLAMHAVVFCVLLHCTLESTHTFSLETIGGPMFVLLMCHLFTGLCFIYYHGLNYAKPPSAYMVLFSVTIFIGTVLAMVQSLVLTLLSKNFGYDWFWGLCALLVPSYTLSQGLFKLAIGAQQNKNCLKFATKLNMSMDNLCCSKDEVTGECSGLKDHFNDADFGIYKNLIYLLVGAIIYIILIMLYEYKIPQKIWEKVMNENFIYPTLHYSDEDVELEKVKIQEEIDSGNKGSSHFLIHRLAKRYKGNPFRKGHTAVKDISFGIKQGECFGLLGANGAGKTTTFRMLVGAEVPTRGRCHIKGSGLLGYCPQFDALDKYLTGRQVLNFYCNIRGLPHKYIKKHVDYMISNAGLSELGDVVCDGYSGGSRRKLSAAVAIGGAVRGSGVLLDEPSAGVDPRSRLALHFMLQNTRARGRIVLLSSHSMEECEKLVNRLGILSTGELACLGPVQRLKDRFGTGFVLSLKLKTLSKNCDRQSMAENQIHAGTNASTAHNPPLAPSESCDRPSTVRNCMDLLEDQVDSKTSVYTPQYTPSVLSEDPVQPSLARDGIDSSEDQFGATNSTFTSEYSPLFLSENRKRPLTVRDGIHSSDGHVGAKTSATNSNSKDRDRSSTVKDCFDSSEVQDHAGTSVATSDSINPQSKNCDRSSTVKDCSEIAEDRVDASTSHPKYSQDIPLIDAPIEGKLFNLKNSIDDAFQCKLKDQHLTILQYHIDDRSTQYSTLFRKMEMIKSAYEDVLEDYTISDTTLEQVFLSFNAQNNPSTV